MYVSLSNGLNRKMMKPSKRFVVLIIYPFRVASLHNSAYHYLMCKCTPQCKRLKHLLVYNRITPKATLICRWGVFSWCHSFLSHVWLRIYAEGKRNTFENQLIPRLHLVMKGIHKLTSISKNLSRVCVPITSDILQGFNIVLSAEPDSYFNKMMWAVCCMSLVFYAQAILSQYHYNPEVHQISCWIKGTCLLWCAYI